VFCFFYSKRGNFLINFRTFVLGNGLLPIPFKQLYESLVETLPLFVKKKFKIQVETVVVRPVFQSFQTFSTKDLCILFQKIEVARKLFRLALWLCSRQSADKVKEG